MNDLPLTGVSHLELYVSDLDASLAWYESAVGLTLLRTYPQGLAVLQPPTGSFRLVLRPDRPADAHGDFGHVAFAVENLTVLEAWAEHLDEAGVSYKGIKESPTGYTIDLVDPDGHQIELTYES